MGLGNESEGEGKEPKVGPAYVEWVVINEADVLLGMCTLCLLCNDGIDSLCRFGTDTISDTVSA